jgi:hypothetical protein
MTYSDETIVVLISAVQLDGIGEISINVSVAQGERVDRIRLALGELDSYGDLQDYLRQAVAAICEAL